MTNRESYQLRNIRAESFFFGKSHEFSMYLKYSFGAIKSSYKSIDVNDNLNKMR